VKDTDSQAEDVMTPNEFGFPIFSYHPTHPWQLINANGELWRHPPEGRRHRAMTFQTGEKALAFRDKMYTKVQKGKLVPSSLWEG
jgi:hypothetical protein